MSKLKSDIWKQLVEEAGVAEIDAAASITVEQAEAELAAAGFDVAAERAKAGAFLDALESGAAPADAKAAPSPSRPHVPRGRRRPVLLWLAAVAAVTVAGGALYAALSQPPPRTPAPRPTPDPVPSAVPNPVLLRRQAADACDAQQWGECLADLDEARAVDPDGDAKPAMKALRARAMRGGSDKPQP